ncbi:MAG: hypothetical protein H6832_06505 [Planctomycetes bacterium]|nr:hypothetical protein [Planctomycetota bacterium]MCB9918038.1 hypothetical protein [Planctomycetota bacterium]
MSLDASATSTSFCLRACLLIGTSLAATITAHGQGVPAFAELQLPGGALAASVTQLGKIAAYDDGATLYSFSAHTRKWSGIAKSAAATLRQANDWFLLVDGTRYSAFSAIHGTWRSVTVSPSAVVLNPASQRNDSIVLVQDGTTIHAYSGFTGQWVSRSFGATTAFAVQRHAAMAADGTTLWGIGAFDMIWRSQAMTTTATRVVADSFGGYAEAGGTVYGYSAQTRTFASASLPPGAVSVSESGDVAIWHAAPQALAWSALRGSFATLTVGTGAAIVESSRQVGLIALAATTHFYSAALGTWTSVSVPVSATRILDSTTALVVDASNVHAYSAWTGTVASLAQTVTQPQVTRAVAAAVSSSGMPLIYSAITGQWHAVPTGTLSQPALLSVHGGLVRTSTGFAAFASRTGTFTPFATSNGVPISDPSTAIVGIIEPNRLSVFEERGPRWHSRTVQNAPVPATWRMVLINADGNKLDGFGAQNGILEQQVIPASTLPIALRASSEVATAQHAKGLWGYSSLPDVLTGAQYPEFRRIFVTGNPLPLYVSAPASSAVVSLVGARAASPLSTPFGDLHVDLASLVVGPVLSVSTAGTASVELATPNVPSLRGLDLAWQGFVVPNGPAPAYLTRAAATLLR